MSAFHDNALMGASGSQGYTISRSVRLRSSASAYFNRTFTTPTNNKIWTWSGWGKRGKLATAQDLFGGGSSASSYAYIGFTSSDTIRIWSLVSSSVQIDCVTSSVFRDPSAWYHVVLSVDTTQATNSNGVKLYINGVQQTLTFSTYVQNSNTYFNSSALHSIGALNYTASIIEYLDGYLTEINFIDGQALTPSSFGETDAITGVWKPKKYSGTYGTNGFYLNFSDNSNNTATTIGKDYSGNGNNWTPNNISVTSGVTYDSMLDVPTPYADGGNGRGNYAILNPVNKNSSMSIYDGNLAANMTATAGGFSACSFALTTGKWYFEVTDQHTSTNYITGAGLITQSFIHGGSGAGSYYIFDANPNQLNSYSNGTFVATIANGAPNLVNGDIIQVAYDADAGKIWFGKNGTWYPAAVGGSAGNPSAGTNPTLSSVPSGLVPSSVHYGTTAAMSTNFGQRPFSYTPPTGFNALNTQNLSAGTITTSGSFTGNASADGPFVYLNGVPTAMTINGNAVTFGTHADKTANGFKVRSSSSSYNASGSNTYSISTTGAKFKYANAQGNP